MGDIKELTPKKENHTYWKVSFVVQDKNLDSWLSELRQMNGLEYFQIYIGDR